jgi:hypothetical protein
MKLPDEKIEFLRALAASERWECEIPGLASHASMALSKETVRALLDAHEWGTAERILRAQIEKERLAATREIDRLRAALADIARGDYSDPLCQRTPEQRARDALAHKAQT